MPAIQSNRLISVTTPLGDDVLLFHRLSGTEQLSHLYEYEVECLSVEHSIGLDKILGQTICVHLSLVDGGTRHFNGFVSRFSQHGTLGEYHCYRAIVRPWPWFLTRASNCRIFQEMTVPDIVKQVCGDHGFTDIEDKLSDTYRTWVYCVQYRETDFNFISRLLEQEGIYFYFKHEENKHLLVLADSISAHESIGDIPYYPEDNRDTRERDHIDTLSLCQQFQSCVYALNDYDFEKPKASLLVKSAKAPRNHAHSDFEQYDYPGEYLATGDGDSYANSRINELQSQFEQVEGGGNVRGLSAGALFELSNYPRDDQNREYLVISTNYQLQSNAYISGRGSGEEDCNCSFSSIDSQQAFKPQRITPKPIVQGPQTAVVVGPSGEEIYTDKYGRVKVQFHWDREGKKDEKSSCWVRVSHATAGKSWGYVQIPRIGQEVIVSFLEGDPDHPIITGRVYNADQMHPFELPGKDMVSGMKSDTTPDSGGYNEYSMDDTKGEELITVHGQFDMDTTIENDLREHVLHDRSRDVTNDETVSVGHNQSYSVGNDRSRDVTNNETISIGKDQSYSIGENQTGSVGANKTISVEKNSSETVGKDKTVQVSDNNSESVGKDKTVDVGDNMSESSGKKMSFSAGDDYAVVGDKKGVIQMADELTIKVGKATINMKKNGDITINGKKITVKGSGDVILKGSKVLAN